MVVPPQGHVSVFTGVPVIIIMETLFVFLNLATYRQFTKKKKGKQTNKQKQNKTKSKNKTKKKQTKSKLH